MRMPDPQEFRKNVEESEEIHGITDCVYNQCIEEFSRTKISELNEKHELRIVRPYLLTWGVMVRVLGFQGVKIICKKLKDIKEKIEPFRHKDFLTVNLSEIEDSVIKLFDEIRETKFKSKKGKQKPVGSTAASKVLHLVCPDLFVPWDFSIRTKGYKKREGDGKDYFEFLIEMKSIANRLETIIKDLQQKYGKRVPRILDQYNWMKFTNFGQQ